MSGADADDGDERGGSVREQDRFLPIANISRIMKKALPPNAKIAKDAKETVQECVSEFISFITSECGPAPLAGSCLLARPSCHAQVLAVSAVDLQALHTGGSADKTTGRMPCMPCLPPTSTLCLCCAASKLTYAAFATGPATSANGRSGKQ